jgi:DNA-binding NarL/FixJ family response regulator
MKVLLVDDHEVVRDGLKTILSDEFLSIEIKEADNGTDAEKLARKEKLDIIIMDISMSGKTGLNVLKQLRSELIKTPILILSTHPENQYAIRVLKLGGNGYLTKDCLRAELVSAVKLIVSGKKYISANIAAKLAMRFDDDASKEPHELLSDRELEVLKLIAKGKTVSQIAEELSLSIPTISTYRARLIEKMQMKNNSELTIYAINNGLV